MKMKSILYVFLAILSVQAVHSRNTVEARVLPEIRLPQGFEISVFAHGLAAPRQLAVDSDGNVFVGSGSGAVYALKDTDRDGNADQYSAIKGFRDPRGVVLHNGNLYVGDISYISVLHDAAANFNEAGKKSFKTVLDGLPNSSHHGARYIRIRNDRLYVSLGVPCNICIPPDPELTGTIRSYTLNGADPVTHAYGVRNSVGYDWHPLTGELWFTDNGRDWLGDDLPSDEINRVQHNGNHFGFPYCHQGDLVDPEFDSRDCGEFVPPVVLTGPHVANLGMRFVIGEMFPGNYRNSILVALHGSWNRSEKIGYGVHVAFLDADGHLESYEPFATGWLQGQKVLGRPVDLAFMPDGSLLVSDDHAGAIYRIVYNG